MSSEYTLPAPGLATRGLHGDHPDVHRDENYAIAPDLQLTTTYRLPHPESNVAEQLRQAGGEAGLDWQSPPLHVYSRFTTDTRGRTEKVLSGLIGAHAITYASGLTAAYAAILHYAPSVIAIRKGYHGVHEGIRISQRSHDLKVIDLDDEYPSDLKTTVRGDGSKTPKGGLLVWVESPLNPTGEVRDISQYAKRAHDANGVVAVDSTFAPLQNVFECGADMVMHSATKYFGGHSDLLMGILATQDKTQWAQLFDDRSHVGGMPGNLESWLLLRSLRTLQVRWRQQSATATQLAQWLRSLVADSSGSEGSAKTESKEDEAIRKAGFITRVWHASFQPRTDKDPSQTPRFDEGKSFDPTHQMRAGWPATFSFRVRGNEAARLLPHKTVYFSAATSLGGVESLMEHRLGSDPTEEPELIRVSVGLEDFVDLQADLRSAILQVLS